MTGIYDDVGYTGEVYDPDSLTRFADLDFYRDKIREFQVSLNELDATAQEMREFAALPLPPAEYDAALSWLIDYETNRERAILAAQTINIASSTANALGVRMPVLSWSLQGMGNPAALAAIAGAVAGAAWFLSYSVERIMSARVLIEQTKANQAIIESLPQDQRAGVAAQLAKQATAVAQAQARAENPIASVANVVKWVALGAAAFFAFRAFQLTRG